MEESYQYQLPDPWDRESAFTRLLLVDGAVNGKARFHVIDPWHMLHLGIGKAWAASGVLLLQALVGESNVEKRIAVVAAEYKEFCKREKIDPIIRKIDLSTFGGGGSNEANGAWHKAAITSNWLRFLEDYCTRTIDLRTASEKIRIFVPIHHSSWAINFTCTFYFILWSQMQNCLYDEPHTWVLCYRPGCGNTGNQQVCERHLCP